MWCVDTPKTRAGRSYCPRAGPPAAAVLYSPVPRPPSHLQGDARDVLRLEPPGLKVQGGLANGCPGAAGCIRQGLWRLAVVLL